MGLQAHLTCVCVPWRPTADPAMRRFVSEIVLEEECDVFEDGKTHGSHLELYLRAMVQAGANTAPICSWLAKLEAMSDASGSSRMAESGAAKARLCRACWKIWALRPPPRRTWPPPWTSHRTATLPRLRQSSHSDEKM